jgi:hypothetical protein
MFSTAAVKSSCNCLISRAIFALHSIQKNINQIGEGGKREGIKTEERGIKRKGRTRGEEKERGKREERRRVYLFFEHCLQAKHKEQFVSLCHELYPQLILLPKE